MLVDRNMKFDHAIFPSVGSLAVPQVIYALGQGWATAGTRAKLGTRALKFGTRANPRKWNPSVFQIMKFVTYKSEYYVKKLRVHFVILICQVFIINFNLSGAFGAEWLQTICCDAATSRVQSLSKFFRSERISHLAVFLCTLSSRPPQTFAAFSLKCRRTFSWSLELPFFSDQSPRTQDMALRIWWWNNRFFWDSLRSPNGYDIMANGHL